MLSSRQLAAIMFTDIVGYTALMGEDENKAFELLRKNRQLQKPLIEQFGGKWIKELGDGVLASFSTATDAVLCAASIQKKCQSQQDLKLRIGIHLGEVLFENEDVFGDGVNLASRIQAIAPIGGIWVSEAVYNNIANKKSIGTTFVKAEVLKNVNEPVRIYEVHADDTFSLPSSAFFQTKEPGAVPDKSIAVLPFANMSNDPEQEYFSDGMAEEILNSLAQIKELKVAGRTSSFQFKGKNLDLREVGEKLAVRTVLEGSIRKQGNRLRVTAQLINAKDGYHIWSERYDREMDDIFAIQDEIAMAITEKLKITLLESEKDRNAKTPTESPEAYQLYLKGRFFWYKRGIHLKKSLELFQEAAALDPNFALAFAGMADAYSLMSMYHIGVKPHEGMPKAKAAAERAIQLNPALVEAHTARAIVTAYYDWNWREAPKQFQKAIQLNPNYAPAHIWYSIYLAWAEGRYEEAISEAEKAKSCEPLLSASYHYLAVIFIAARRYGEGAQESRMAIELDPDSFYSYRSLGECLLGLNKLEEGIKALEKAVVLSNRHQWALADLCFGYAFVGRMDAAQEIFKELEVRSKMEHISPLLFSAAAYAVGQHDMAFAILERGYEDREAMLITIRYSGWPILIPMQNDKRYKLIIEKMNFPE